jgi:hypothetical protein
LAHPASPSFLTYLYIRNKQWPKAFSLENSLYGVA